MLERTDFLFTVVNLVVLPFWFLMICLPRWTVTRRLMASYWVVLTLPVVYLILVIPQLPAVLPLLVQPKLSEIATLLGRPEGALVGWIHFLAFDLFVGRWIYLDSQDRPVNRLLLGVILFLTLMLGPVGLAAYLVLLVLAGKKTPANHNDARIPTRRDYPSSDQP